MSELKDRFEHALRPEPPFETELATALDAAVRGGRRRRARAVASKALVVTACTVVVAGAVVAVRPGGSPTPGEHAAAGHAATAPGMTAPTVSATEPACPNGPAVPLPKKLRQRAEAAGLPTYACTGVVPGSEDDLARTGVSAQDLTRLATAIADITGGTVVTEGPYAPFPPGTVQLRTAAGKQEIRVGVEATTLDPGALRAGCGLGASDGKPCRMLATPEGVVAMSARYPAQPGRVDLTYVADAGTTPGGEPRTVRVQVSNYVETSGGKVISPTWQQLGLTPDAIHSAIADSGLLA